MMAILNKTIYSILQVIYFQYYVNIITIPGYVVYFTINIHGAANMLTA